MKRGVWDVYGPLMSNLSDEQLKAFIAAGKRRPRMEGRWTVNFIDWDLLRAENEAARHLKDAMRDRRG